MVNGPILTIFGQGIYLYGVMIAVGILCCFWVLYLYAKLLKVSTSYVDFTFYTGVFAIVVGFFGSAVWQGVFNYIDDMKNYGSATFSLDGGITAIGGLVTGAAAFIIVAFFYRKKYPYLLTQIAWFAPCCMTIAHAFGRLGCFFAGCCYGKDATGFFSFLGVSFPNGSLHSWHGGYYNGTPVYPTQLFEATFLFILFGVMSYLALKKKFKYNFVIYLAAYGTWRFLLEFIRADYRGSFVGSLTPSQTQSLILIACAIPAYFIARYFNKKHEVYKAEQQAAEIEQMQAAEKDTLAPDTVTSKADQQTISDANLLTPNDLDGTKQQK